jgi:Calcium-dependent channel, 7TM region, putative phosphate
VLALVVIVFFNTLVISAITTLVNIDSLAKIIPGFGVIIAQLSPIARQIVQGAIPVVVLAIWTAMMPVMLFCMIEFWFVAFNSRSFRVARNRSVVSN